MTFLPNSNKSSLQVVDEPLYKSEVPAYFTAGVGQVAFGTSPSGTIGGNVNFLWDNANERLSISTTSSIARLNVGASTATIPSVKYILGTNVSAPAQGEMWFSSTSSANHFSWYDGLTHFKFGQLVGTTTTSALYMGEATPSATNYILTRVPGGNTQLNSSTNVIIAIANTARLSILGGASEISASYVITAQNGIRGNTGNPLSIGYVSTQSLASSFSLTSRNVLFAATTYNDTGAVAMPASAPHVYFAQPTFSSVNVKTLADAATVAIEGAPIQGGSLTITRSMSFWVKNGVSKFSGALTLAIRSVTANTSITDSDHTIEVLSGTVTVTLPSAINIAGRIYAISNVSATCSLTGTGGELINGVLTQPIPTGSTIYVQANAAGTGWIII
jgi:hypothetical protein